MRSGVATALLALALCRAPQARAAEIVLEGPRSCSRAAELQERVERALGHPLAEVRPVVCRVHVVRDGGSYAARFAVSADGAAGSRQRSFSGKTCAKLMRTLELAAVLALGTDEGLAPDARDDGSNAAAALASGGKRAGPLPPPSERRAASRLPLVPFAGQGAPLALPAPLTPLQRPQQPRGAQRREVERGPRSDAVLRRAPSPARDVGADAAAAPRGREPRERSVRSAPAAAPSATR